MRQNDLRRILRTMLPPNRLHKVTLGIHQIEINTMIHQIILTLLYAFRRTKVHSILFTYILYLFPSACEADDRGVEFGEVGLQDARRVSCRITSYEEREKGWEGGGGGEKWRGVHKIDHLRHLVELFGADIRAVAEAEVYLFPEAN